MVASEAVNTAGASTARTGFGGTNTMNATAYQTAFNETIAEIFSKKLTSPKNASTCQSVAPTSIASPRSSKGGEETTRVKIMVERRLSRLGQLIEERRQHRIKLAIKKERDAKNKDYRYLVE